MSFGELPWDIQFSNFPTRAKCDSRGLLFIEDVILIF